MTFFTSSVNRTVVGSFGAILLTAVCTIAAAGPAAASTLTWLA